jgi:hypothetical protein
LEALHYLRAAAAAVSLLSLSWISSSFFLSFFLSFFPARKWFADSTSGAN